MIRVVLLTTSLARGGAEIQVAQLARELHARGWDVSVVSLLKPGALEPELRADGVAVCSLDAEGSPLAFARLAALLHRLKPQIVHAHMFHANVAARLARLVCPVPVVISTIHSLAESSRRSKRIRGRDWLYRITESLADRVVCVSEAVAERHTSAGAISRARMRVIPNGVDTARFRPNAAGREEARAALGLGREFAWLAAGRLMWKKNYPLMLEAAARLPGCTLLIAGGGPDQTELEGLARRLGVRTRFLGPRDDMPGLMNACDGLVMSSAVEGLPMVLLEAAASGLPQVATGVGGVAEAVIHEQTGYVAAPGDPEALAAAMARLIAMPGPERAALSRAAREHALSRFDLRAVTGRWEQLYDELLRAERLSSREA
jgi:glycosyltransferase involved in cell wall biosynthesis